jgi:hypothetical protein
MKAAVLHALGGTPRYGEFEEPIPYEDEALVRLPLHPAVRPATDS